MGVEVCRAEVVVVVEVEEGGVNGDEECGRSPCGGWGLPPPPRSVDPVQREPERPVMSL